MILQFAHLRGLNTLIVAIHDEKGFLTYVLEKIMRLHYEVVYLCRKLMHL